MSGQRSDGKVFGNHGRFSPVIPFHDPPGIPFTYHGAFCHGCLFYKLFESAQVSELGMTFAQKSVEGKSNEIPAVQELLKGLDISGCIIVADALNCQKKTAESVVSGGADYVGDAALRGAMEKASQTEKNRDRIEKRSAFVTNEIGWLTGREEWHYYISSRLTACSILILFPIFLKIDFRDILVQRVTVFNG